MKYKERLEDIRAEVEQMTYTSPLNFEKTRINKESVLWLMEKVEELELEINDWRAEVQKWQKFYKESEESHSETKELLKSIVNQNKRYREALEEIMRTETVTTALADGQVAYTFSGHIARKALEGEE